MTEYIAVARSPPRSDQAKSHASRPKAMSDGVIWAYGIGEDAIMAFTEDEVEDLKNLLEMRRENPGLFE